MKRSKGVVKGQVEGEVKRSKTQAAEESSESAPEFNPFLVEPVIVRLLMLVEKVSQLKELRKMCQIWDEFNLQEIEDRAFKGKVKAIDFCWTSITNAEVILVKFMRETQAIPRLFFAFKFNFPDSWIILSKHMDFFSLYPVTFVHLGIPKYGYSYQKASQEMRTLMAKFMESEIGRNLKLITVSAIHKSGHYLGKFGFPDSSIFFPTSGNMARKLQKLDIKGSFPEILQSVFASGKYTNLTSMELTELPGGNLDFPGLVNPSKLTRLEIGKLEDGSPPVLRLTSGLINLAENGMLLKNFGICIKLFYSDNSFAADLSPICFNLTLFLSSQSSTLETLTFGFVCRFSRAVEGAETCKIHLPTFELLHSLKLNVDFQLIATNPRRTHSQLFGMTQSLSGHFPKLVNMTLQGQRSLDALRINSTADDAGKLELEHLEIETTQIYTRKPELLVSAFVSGNYTNLILMGLDEIPCANLEYLGLDLSKLTRLEIGLGRTRKSLAALKLTSGLINLAENGMKLKDLCISIILRQARFYESSRDVEFSFEHLRPICSNLSQFLSSQSSALESLNFTFICHLKNPVNVPEGADICCKIHLPKFEALHTLKLYVDFQMIEANPRRIHTQLFGMTHSLSLHFPKLVNLTLDGESSLMALRVNPATGEAGGLQLERLEILEYVKNPRIWTTSFEGVIGSVEEFECPAKFLNGERLPWGESLCRLHINDKFLRVKEGETFKLSNLKKLKNIVLKYYTIRTEKWTEVRTRSQNQSKKVDDHLRYFKEATELPLTSITFMGPEIGEDLKEGIIKYFLFPVQFKVYIFQKNGAQFHNFTPKYF